MKIKLLDSLSSAEITLPWRFAPAALQAAFLLTDKAYAFIDESDSGAILIFLRLRQPSTPRDLQALVQDFSNEVHTQRIRLALQRVGRSSRRSLMRRAFA